MPDDTRCGRTQRKAATNQLAFPSYSLYVQLLWYPMYYPGGMKAWVSPVQWSKPHSILAPTQDSNPGGRIQNHKRWPLHYHCTHHIMTYMIYRCFVTHHSILLFILWILIESVQAFDLDFYRVLFWDTNNNMLSFLNTTYNKVIDPLLRERVKVMTYGNEVNKTS